MSDTSAPIDALETGPAEEPITHELPLSAVRNAMRPPLPTDPVVIDGVAHERAYPGERIEKLAVLDESGELVGEGLAFLRPEPVVGADVACEDIEFSIEDDGRVLAFVESIPGAMAYGATNVEAERAVRVIVLITKLQNEVDAGRRRIAELTSELSYAETAKQSMRDALEGEQRTLEAKDAEIARYKQAYDNQIAMHVELCKGHADEITQLKVEHGRTILDLSGSYQSEVQQLGLELAGLRTRLASAEASLVEGEHA